MEFKDWIELWFNAVRHPRSTFKKWKSRANYEDGAVNIISSVVIGQVLTAVSIWLLAFAITGLLGINIDDLIAGSQQRGIFSTASADLTFVPLNIVINFVIALAIGLGSWFIFGWIAYKVSHWLNGKGELKTQLYLVSLYTPAFAVLWWFPTVFMNAGLFFGIASKNFLAMFGGLGVSIILLILVFIYQICCFVYALVETHNYSAGTGVGVCALSSLIIGAIVFGIIIVGILVGFAFFSPIPYFK